jgi:hypothetical protein
MPEVTITTSLGAKITFNNEVALINNPLSDLFISTDKTKIVSVYRCNFDEKELDFLKRLATTYRERIFGRPGCEALPAPLAWPEAWAAHGDRFCLVWPAMPDRFIFGPDTNLSGAAKTLNWFVSAKNFNRYLPDADRGALTGYLRCATGLSRAVRILHSVSLAHMDLAPRNCLADPASGQTSLLTEDLLAEPGLPPFRRGLAASFMAPEIVAALARNDAGPPSIPGPAANRHSLAVLVYQLLLHRHPLKGSRVLDPDPQIQENLELGAKALFIEHPSDRSNALRVLADERDYLPWLDTARLPFTVMGPHLARLFRLAFIEGLHAPERRPAPADWERALVQTLDLLLPCGGKACPKGWYVMPDTPRPVCPYCGTGHQGPLAYLDFYVPAPDGASYKPDGLRMAVSNDQYVYPWHVAPGLFPDESLPEADRKPVGYFTRHNGKLVFANTSLDGLRDTMKGLDIRPGQYVELANGQNLLLKPGPGGRAARVAILNP